MVMNFDLTLYLAASKREGLVDIGTKHTLVGGGVRFLTKNVHIIISHCNLSTLKRWRHNHESVAKVSFTGDASRYE